MPEPMGLEEIRRFWTEQAFTHGQSPRASWSDHTVIEMEIGQIAARLDDGDRVVDVGCANGYSTVSYASRKRVAIVGVDYIPEMIDRARARLAALPTPLHGTIEFRVGDVLDLAEPDAAYDRVICTRVLINLGTVEAQLTALRNCLRLLRPGGLLLLSEATLQGWSRLNAMRREWGLDDLPMPSFNLYLDQDAIAAALAPTADLVEIVDFSSTYYVGTRVLKPLLAQLTGAPVDVADPDMEWNRWFGQLPAWGDYGTQKLIVIRKR